MSILHRLNSPWQNIETNNRILVVIIITLAIFILVLPCKADQGPVPDWTLTDVSPFDLITPPGIKNPVLQASDVTDVSAQFVADPFIFHQSGRWYMFFEVLNGDTGLGQIGVADSNDGLHWSYDRIVLAEGFHLSFPYVFEYLGDYYMMPETSNIQEIRLYKAHNFPYEWHYFTTLVKGKHYVDPAIFHYNGSWWLFAGGGWSSTYKGNCFLFYSDNLLSGWTEHPKSPVIVNNPGKSRPGGRSFVYSNGRVIRLAQKDDLSYGEQVRAFEVDVLTKTSYSEHEIAQSPIIKKTGNGWNADGMHTFDPWWAGDHWICSVDGQKSDIWSIGIYVTPVIGNCLLNSKFEEKTLAEGETYYTDRDYILNSVPTQYLGMEMIGTPNDERNLTTTSSYMTFKMPEDGAVYIAYDSRAISEPDWMNGFIDTGDIIKTSLSSQPALKIYSKSYDAGDCINFGANKAQGFTGDTISNYIVFYRKVNEGPAGCTLDAKFEETALKVGTNYYADRDYTITGGFPDWMIGRTLIQTPNDDRFNAAISGYVRFINPVSWWVYVLFDSRSSAIPGWLKGWELRSDIQIKTSLSSQPYLKVYRKMFDAGQCVDLGGNYGPGSSGETRSNYVVVYGQ